MRASIRCKKIPHVGCISTTLLGSSVVGQFSDDSIVPQRDAGLEATRAAGGGGGAVWTGCVSVHATPILFRVLVSYAEVLAEPAEELHRSLDKFWGFNRSYINQLVDCVQAEAWDYRHRPCPVFFLVAHCGGAVCVHCFRRMSSYLDWLLHGSLF